MNRLPGISPTVARAYRPLILGAVLGALLWAAILGAAWFLGTADYNNRDPIIAPPPVLQEPPPVLRETMRYQNALQAHENRVSRVSALLGGSRYLAEIVVAHSAVNGLAPDLVAGVILTENPWLKPDTVNSYGAVGLMQVVGWLHQGAYPECGDNLTDPQTNVCYGTSLLAGMLERYGGDLDRALLAYNGCQGATYIPGCERYTVTVYTRGGV